MKKNLLVPVLIFIVISIAVVKLSTAQDKTGEPLWKIYVNGVETKIVPMILNGKVYVPLQDTADALNMSVKQDETSKTLILMGSSSGPQTVGVVSGDVGGGIILPGGKTFPFEGVKVALTAVDNSPDVDRKLKLHFIDPENDYFKTHPILASGAVDKNNKFVIPDVSPGTYDIVVFNKFSDFWGFWRIIWKIQVWVDPGKETKVRLDYLDKLVFDYLMSRK
ncbi:MAG: copper amine oxidase N-terminal domain-containing protein [Firmicutes bacterium]|nr:copper amine oxidase N-terminal domain-containing protein [Bacillota bacterium]